MKFLISPNYTKILTEGYYVLIVNNTFEYREIKMIKKILPLALIFSAFVILLSCETHKGDKENYFFNAMILEIIGNSVTVEPVEGESILRNADKIMFVTGHLDKIGASVGDIVKIQYTGTIRESYPAQIDVISWSIYKNK